MYLLKFLNGIKILRTNKNHLLNIYFLVSILFVNQLFATNNFGCKYDSSVCEIDEYCYLDFPIGGLCLRRLSQYDYDIGANNEIKSKRIEYSEEDSSSQFKSPIRIHKYDKNGLFNIKQFQSDENDNVYDSNENSESNERINSINAKPLLNYETFQNSDPYLKLDTIIKKFKLDDLNDNHRQLELSNDLPKKENVDYKNVYDFIPNDNGNFDDDEDDDDDNFDDEQIENYLKRTDPILLDNSNDIPGYYDLEALLDKILNRKNRLKRNTYNLLKPNKDKNGFTFDQLITNDDNNEKNTQNKNKFIGLKHIEYGASEKPQNGKHLNLVEYAVESNPNVDYKQLNEQDELIKDIVDDLDDQELEAFNGDGKNRFQESFIDDELKKINKQSEAEFDREMKYLLSLSKLVNKNLPVVVQGLNSENIENDQIRPLGDDIKGDISKDIEELLEKPNDLESSDSESKKTKENFKNPHDAPSAHDKSFQASINENQNTNEETYMMNDENYMFGDLNTAPETYVTIEVEQSFSNKTDALKLLYYLANSINLVPNSFQKINIGDNKIIFAINNQDSATAANKLIDEIVRNHDDIKNQFQINILSANAAKNENEININTRSFQQAETKKSKQYLSIIIATSAILITLLILVIALILIKRRSYSNKKLLNESSFKSFTEDLPSSLVNSIKKHTKSHKETIYSFWPFKKDEIDSLNKTDDDTKTLTNQDYQELCRERVQSKNQQITDEKLLIHPATPQQSSASTTITANTPIIQSRITSLSSNETKSCDSNRSSTSSWSEEPISTVNMDITTGHVILSYMEKHLNDKSSISKEWDALCNYVAESNSTDIAKLPLNVSRNRYSNALPYDRTRIALHEVKDSDYINASAITDHDPKHVAYIATQGPLVHTTQEFWQMIWEQSSIVIVCLCRTCEYGLMKCNQYWPSNGHEIYNKFEVNLVSEHVWCEDYIVRSFYLKNIETNETRTVTQFHFISWPENDVPQNIKSVLDFRRKVNKSYKSKSCPIVVHCNDGIGRTGTYILIDMVLNRIVKGAKEIDIAATLEFLRDQRPGMVRTKAQFEFAFAVITEELQNMLKALSQ